MCACACACDRTHLREQYASMFLMILYTPIEIEVVGKRLNHGRGYGLEIPIKYRFYSQEKIVQWLTKKLGTIKKSQNTKFLNFEITFKRHLANCFLYSSSLAAKITSKLFIVFANWREKRARQTSSCRKQCLLNRVSANYLSAFQKVFWRV